MQRNPYLLEEAHSEDQTLLRHGTFSMHSHFCSIALCSICTQIHKMSKNCMSSLQCHSLFLAAQALQHAWLCTWEMWQNLGLKIHKSQKKDTLLGLPHLGQSIEVKQLPYAQSVTMHEKCKHLHMYNILQKCECRLKEPPLPAGNRESCIFNETLPIKEGETINRTKHYWKGQSWMNKRNGQGL